MSKKLFAIILIVCLAVGVAFAEKGDIKVGAQAGFGTDRFRIAGEMMNVKSVQKYNNNGFFFVATGEYDVTDEIGVKLEAGILTMGETQFYVKTGDSDADTEGLEDSVPVNFSVYLGGQYAFDITDEIGIAAGLGLDMMIGKNYISESVSDEVNARIGVGAEVMGSYAVTKDIDVTLGARYAIYFINTNSKVSDNVSHLRDDLDVSVFQSGLKIFAGATYAL